MTTYRIGDVNSEEVVSHLREKYPEWRFKDHTKSTFNHMNIWMKKGETTVKITKQLGGILRVRVVYGLFAHLITFGFCDLLKPFLTGRLRSDLNEDVGRNFGTR